MTLTKKLSDFSSGSLGGFVYFDFAPQELINFESLQTAEAIQTAVLAIFVGLISTGIKDFVKRIFRKKSKVNGSDQKVN